MSKIALITADRNDRPELLKYCFEQMAMQTRKADWHLLIQDKAVPGVIDLVPRIRKGVEAARRLGADICLIIENDDYYPEDYIEQMSKLLEKCDIAGSPTTVYYSLQDNSFRYFNHPGRSSLFVTGFRPEALDSFIWPPDDMLYFDRYLWENIKGTKGFLSFHEMSMPIGMKHGIGFSPGNFHNNQSNGRPMKNMIQDPVRNWLINHVRRNAFYFYQDIMPCINR